MPLAISATASEGAVSPENAVFEVEAVGKRRSHRRVRHNRRRNLRLSSCITAPDADTSCTLNETLLTATAVATVRRQICLRQTYGRSFPIALTGTAQ